jgi:hypothetical protein
MWDFVKRGRTRTRPSFVRGWAQRQEEMKRASCAVVYHQSFLDLLRFSHGRVEKHTNVFKLSRYHLRHPPPPLEKTTTNQGERKGGQIACIWAAVVLLHCVVVNAWERRATRVCLLHDSIAIHERGPQSRSADDVKVEWAVAAANTFFRYKPNKLCQLKKGFWFYGSRRRCDAGWFTQHKQTIWFL